MKYLLNAVLIASFLLLSANFSNAQTKFLVSEYKNVSGSTAGEWFELLVIEDNVSIVGYYVRDNSGTGDWMGGIVFKDVPLWRNLRKGTSILINTRGFSAPDVDPSDGFIKVDAENPTYFEKRIENAISWENVLNFNQATECVQLLDNNDKHHHALAQSTFPVLTAIASLPYPKVVHQDNNNAASVRYYGYGGGPYHQASGTDSTTNVTIGETPGYANVGPLPQSLNINQLYWRALRQPQWQNPILNISFVGNGIKLSWNAASDLNPADKTQGYIVLRRLKEGASTPDIPEDSRVYQVGANIGSSVVLANVQGSDVTEFIDSKYDCGKEYIYSVFAYRYNNTGDETDNFPTRGRGRSYNEGSYAKNEVKTPAIGTPAISIIGDGHLIYCVGDVVSIAADVPSGNYSYQWLVNNRVFSSDNKDTIEINVTKGIARVVLKITNELNCSSVSNEIIFEGVDRPTPYLARIQGKNETKYYKDETVYLCLGDTLTLNGMAGIIGTDVKITWYKDGSIWKQNSNIVKITESGEYYFIASNKSDCQAQSYKIAAVFREYNYKIEPTLLTFAVDESDAYLDKTLTITNNADSELLITSDMLIIPTGAGYSIVDPATFPIVVAAKSQRVITMRFTPPGTELYRGRFIIRTPCGSKFADLMGYRDLGKPTLSAGNPDIFLGSYLHCQLPAKIDSTLLITAMGNEKIILGTPINQNETDFSLKVASLPASLNPFESFSVTVELLNRSIGLHTTSILVPYLPSISGTEYDTLRLSISANIYEPTISTLEVYDSGSITSCEPTVSFQLPVTNTSETEIVLSEQFNDSRLQISNLPIALLPGETAELSVSLNMTAQDEDFTAELPFEPCDSHKSIRFIAHYEGMIFNLSDNSADFGIMYTCQNEKKKELTLSISNYQTSAKVSSIFISDAGDYSIEGLEVGKQLSATNQFTINIINNEIKDYSGQIEITFEPCDNKLIIPISGAIEELVYEFSGLPQSTLDFGVVSVGATETRSFTFINNSKEPIVIAYPSDVAAPFSLVAPASFPLTVPSAGTVEFTYSFSPTDYDLNMSLDVSLNIISPCNIENIVKLTAASERHQLSILGRLELPALRILGRLGETVKVPISLISKSADSIKHSEMSKISFDLNYNSKLLYPKSVVAKGKMVGNVKSMTITENSYGKATVSIEPQDIALFDDGDFIEIDFLVLLGDALKTNISISDISIESLNSVTLESTVAEFEVTGECAPASRLLQMGSMAGLAAVGNRSNGTYNIEVSHIVDSELNLLVYDALGNKVAELFDGFKKSGNYLFHLDTSNFASGVYIINMTFEGGSATEKIIIGR